MRLTDKKYEQIKDDITNNLDVNSVNFIATLLNICDNHWSKIETEKYGSKIYWSIKFLKDDIRKMFAESLDNDVTIWYPVNEDKS